MNQAGRRLQYGKEATYMVRRLGPATADHYPGLALDLAQAVGLELSIGLVLACSSAMGTTDSC